MAMNDDANPSSATSTRIPRPRTRPRGKDKGKGKGKGRSRGTAKLCGDGVAASGGPRFYGLGIPDEDLGQLPGKLIVVEGADGSGRSTQIAKLADWLECIGYATVSVGLKRSHLISEELAEAQKGKVLTARTMSLFYATDFADQLENVMIPALKAGFIVLADRYIYTLIARGLVRGLSGEWLRNLYGIAPIPDAVFYLSVSAEELMQRNFAKDFALDYWESGMDLGLSQDMFDSFLVYQKMIQGQFERMKAVYGFTIRNGNRPVEVIRADLQRKIESVLAGRSRPMLKAPASLDL